MSSSGAYEKVLLTNLKVWERCPSDDPTAVSLRDAFADPAAPDLQIRPIPYAPLTLPRHHVILQPDGSIWKDGSLYLFEKALRGIKATTISNLAGDLANFMNKMKEGNVNYLNFDGPTFRRPTYYYKNTLRQEIANGLSRKTANRKISSMVGMYRFISAKGFKPSQEMWESNTKIINRSDRYGFQHAYEIICTDLTFSVSPNNNDIEHIQDGGKLYPLDLDQQDLLLAALARIHNPEMWLIHIVAIATGMRIQTILTLRIHSIKKDVKDNEEEYLFPIPIGPDTGVDSKGGKPGNILMPGWLHRMLSVYIKSQRATYRRSKSIMENTGMQYAFLTRGGKPYYVAEEDKEALESGESGSAIRQFQKTIEEHLKSIGKHFKYRFHDLRATFGMNLLEDYIMKNQKLVEGLGLNSYMQLHELELIDVIRSRLNHTDINITLGYLRYRRNHHLVGRAQTDFEAHLRDIAKEHWSKHGGNYTELDNS